MCGIIIEWKKLVRVYTQNNLDSRLEFSDNTEPSFCSL